MGDKELNPLIHNPHNAALFGTMIGEWFRQGVIGSQELETIRECGVRADLSDALGRGSIDYNVRDTLWNSFETARQVAMFGHEGEPTARMHYDCEGLDMQDTHWHCHTHNIFNLSY